MENNQRSFWHFSDQLRVQASNLANLSVNESVWSTNQGTKMPNERRNFDIRVGGELNSLRNLNPKGSEFNGFSDGWNSLKLKGSELNGFKDGSNSLKPKGSDGFNDGWNSLKSKGSDFNGVNDGWSSLKSEGSAFNGINDGWNSFKPKMTDFNGSNDGWKTALSGTGSGPVFGGFQNIAGTNGGFNKGIYNIDVKGLKSGFKGEDDRGGKAGKKNGNGNKKNSGENNNDSKDSNGALDKRFKTLPQSESLPRNETVGGYIFVCNNDTMQENLKRQLFGLPPRYRDSVRAITPGLPLFLYNYSTHQLHGIFEAASFGGTNIDPTAWEDKKCPGESRFPAQVRVLTRKLCEPLEEDSFRPILHHYDGPKFRLELSIPEALSLLDVFGYLQNKTLEQQTTYACTLI
ncbi:DCD domain-containing protein NRP-B-like [Juglans microcarpa x Juglans regia]|uniref:DCD domain-containing protein NRP-B-like n=1 Tax=Juglans microcarpa x Juglans regia TaxID=2249226 RepID=UPI001B7E8145|nr:DCD domain-containing protein NRP-B-like [Juglans microcarpa x Juglans regia]